MLQNIISDQKLDFYQHEKLKSRMLDMEMLKFVIAGSGDGRAKLNYIKSSHLKK